MSPTSDTSTWRGHTCWDACSYPRRQISPQNTGTTHSERPFLTMAKMLCALIVLYKEILFKDKYIYFGCLIRRLIIYRNAGEDLKFFKKRKQEMFRTAIRRFLKFYVLLLIPADIHHHPTHTFKTFNMTHVVLSIPQDPVHLPGLNANKYLPDCNNCLNVWLTS